MYSGFPIEAPAIKKAEKPPMKPPKDDESSIQNMIDEGYDLEELKAYMRSESSNQLKEMLKTIV